MIFESSFYNMRTFLNCKFYLGFMKVDFEGSNKDQVGHWNTGKDSSEIKWVYTSSWSNKKVGGSSSFSEPDYFITIYNSFVMHAH